MAPLAVSGTLTLVDQELSVRTRRISYSEHAEAFTNTIVWFFKWATALVQMFDKLQDRIIFEL